MSLFSQRSMISKWMNRVPLKIKLVKVYMVTNSFPVMSSIRHTIVRLVAFLLQLPENDQLVHHFHSSGGWTTKRTETTLRTCAANTRLTKVCIEKTVPITVSHKTVDGTVYMKHPAPAEPTLVIKSSITVCFESIWSTIYSTITETQTYNRYRTHYNDDTHDNDASIASTETPSANNKAIHVEL